MSLHIAMPMPDETFLREWEHGITRIVRSGPSFPILDPAFIPREPNPTVEIGTEDGRILWSQWSDDFRRAFGLPVVSVPARLPDGDPDSVSQGATRER